MTALVERAAVGVERRPARRSDLALIRELYAESRDELCLLPSDTRDVIVDMRLRACRRGPGHGDPRHEVVTEHGTAVGHVLTTTECATSNPATTGLAITTVVDVAVVSQLRGRGLASYLLAELIVQADRDGRIMQARVRHDNVAALRFFARHGFTASDTVAGCRRLVRAPKAVSAGA